MKYSATTSIVSFASKSLATVEYRMGGLLIKRTLLSEAFFYLASLTADFFPPEPLTVLLMSLNVDVNE